MKYYIDIKGRDFTGIDLSGLRFQVEKYSFSAVGGCDAATVSVKGSNANLWRLVGMLRCQVEIYTGNGTLIWIGFINDVQVQPKDQVLGMAIGLASMANSVKVAYSYVEPGVFSAGQRKTTTAATDAASIAEYGTKELLKSTGGMSDAAATAERDNTLARVKYPQGNLVQGTPGTAVLQCQGWWHSLDWRGASVSVTQAISNWNQTLDQNFKSIVSASQAFQQIVPTVTINAKTVQLWVRKVGAPLDNLVVELRSTNAAGNPDLAVGALASFTLAGTTITTSYAAYNTALSAETQLAKGAIYALRIYRSGATDLVNYFQVGMDGSLAYTAGEFRTSVDNGATWQLRADADLAFIIYQNNLVENTQQVVDLITTYGEFFTGTIVESASGILSSSYRNGEKTARQEIEALLDQGKSGGRRYLAEMENTRQARLYEEPAAPSSPDYMLRADGSLIDQAQHVALGDVDISASWCGLLGVIPDSVDFSVLAPIQPFFIEWAEWDTKMAKWNFTLRGNPGIWD